MLKQIIAILVLSAVIVLFMSHAQQALQMLVNGHEWVAQWLGQVFSEGHAGNFAKGLIALLAIPLLVGLIPAFIYWLAKRHWFPYFMPIVWVIWLVQAGALITLSQVGV